MATALVYERGFGGGTLSAAQQNELKVLLDAQQAKFAFRIGD